MNKSSRGLKEMVVVFLSIAITGALLSSADASGQTLKSPINTSPISFRDDNEYFDLGGEGKAQQVSKSSWLSSLACIIASRAWFVNEDICR